MSVIEQPAAVSGLPLARLACSRLVGVDFRDATQTGDGSYTFTGHAAVFDITTTLWEMDGYRVRERISRQAFDQVLSTNPDVHLNINHDMARAIARTGIPGVGGLELSIDQVGLRVFARLDPDDPDVVALAAKMRRGIIDQMSFAFTIAAEARVSVTEPDGETDVLYTIEQIGQLYDVCACAQGAYPQTDSNLRSYLAALGRSNPEGRPDRAAEAGRQNLDDRAAEAGHEDEASQLAFAKAKARARARATRARLDHATRDVFSETPANADDAEPGESLGEDLAEAIESLSDLLADGYDLSMEADADAGTTVRDEIVECIGYLSDVLAGSANPTTGADQ